MDPSVRAQDLLLGAVAARQDDEFMQLQGIICIANLCLTGTAPASGAHGLMVRPLTSRAAQHALLCRAQKTWRRS